MDALIHAANLLRLCAFFQHDAMRPRLLTACAALLLIGYLATRAEPMIELITWNAFFVAVNLGQVSYEVFRKRLLARSSEAAFDPGSRGEHQSVVTEAPRDL